MPRTALKLSASIAAMPLSAVLIGLTHNDIFFLSFLAGLLASILYWVDLGRELRQTQSAGTTARILGVVMGVPQALLGLISAGVGLSIIGWVLYNTFIERQPQYSGGFLTLGIGPILVLFGLAWVRSAFRNE